MDRIVTIDIHNKKVMGVTSPKCVFDCYEAGYAGVNYFLKNLKSFDDLVIVSPDEGAIKRAKKFQKAFNYHGHDKVEMATIIKERKKANVVESATLYGDVKGKTCIVVDDMIDTAGTLCAAAKTIKEDGGAKDVYVFATHGIFSGPAGDRLSAAVRAGHLKTVVTSDSMPMTPEFKEKMGDGHATVSLDLMIAEIIRRLHQREGNQDI
jgi:ribose-phosphate pyrophosphokinase